MWLRDDVPLLLDPVQFLGEELTPAGGLWPAAVLPPTPVHVGALLRRIAPSVSRLASLWLPLMSRMAQRTPRSATDPTFDNVVWVRDEPAPAYVRITLLRPHGREAEALKAKA